MRLLMALTQRDEQEDVAVLGHLTRERLGRAQRLGVALAFREVADAPHFQLDRGRLRGGDLRVGGDRIHAAPSIRKAGIAARL